MSAGLLLLVLAAFDLGPEDQPLASEIAIEVAAIVESEADSLPAVGEQPWAYRPSLATYCDIESVDGGLANACRLPKKGW
jgi:hypothetical protein